MSEVIHLHRAHTIFHSRRGHLRTQNASKLRAAGASPQTPLGSLPLPKTQPPLSALLASGLANEGPKLMPWLQLRFDYDTIYTIRLRRITRACFQFDASKKSTCMSVFRRSRIVVESQYCDAGFIVIVEPEPLRALLRHCMGRQTKGCSQKLYLQ